MLSRFFGAIVVCLAVDVAAYGQDFPKAELFGGYAYGNFSSVQSGQGRTNLNGWNGSLAVNLSHWFGLVSDFGGLYGSSGGAIIQLPLLCVPAGCSTAKISESDKYHTFLIGPQISLRKDKATPFVHMLFGGARFNRSGTETIQLVPPGPPTIQIPFSSSSSNFSFAGGGGVDYKFTDSLSWRIQADYLQVGIPGRTLNNVRASTGVVFHF